MGTANRTAVATATAPDTRYEEHKQMLESRRREIEQEIQARLSTSRNTEISGVVDSEEAAVVGVDSDAGLALIQMRAADLTRIDEAITEIDKGLFGRCNACGQEIGPARLKAVPDAVRCRDCEDIRERMNAHMPKPGRPERVEFQKSLNYRPDE